MSRWALLDVGDAAVLDFATCLLLAEAEPSPAWQLWTVMGRACQLGLRIVGWEGAAAFGWVEHLQSIGTQGSVSCFQ